MCLPLESTDDPFHKTPQQLLPPQLQTTPRALKQLFPPIPQSSEQNEILSSHPSTAQYPHWVHAQQPQHWGHNHYYPSYYYPSSTPPSSSKEALQPEPKYHLSQPGGQHQQDKPADLSSQVELSVRLSKEEVKKSLILCYIHKIIILLFCNSVIFRITPDLCNRTSWNPRLKNDYPTSKKVKIYIHIITLMQQRSIL